MKFAKRITIMMFLWFLLFASSAVFAQDSGGQASRSVRLPEAPQDVSNAPVEQPPTADSGQVAGSTAPQEEKVYLNVQDQEITDIVKQIAKATGKNFILDDKIRGKVTILSEKMLTKEEAFQAFISALEVAGFTIVTGPAGIIKIVSHKEAIQSPIPIHVDSTPYTDSYITRLIKLENISAMEMSNAIKGLVSASGNLFAYPATNTLILTDSGTNIDRMMKIIKELDQEGPQQVIEIIPLRYADSKTMASMVLGLFESERGGGGGGAVRGRAAQADTGTEAEVSKIIADDRTNSLIVVVSKRSLDRVKELIARLDKPLNVGDTGTIHVHYLKYANAKELAATLSGVTSGGTVPRTGGGGGAPGAPGGAGGAQGGGNAVATLEGGVKIGADDTTNALIITASAKDYKLLVDELIAKLDIPRKQVYLESMIMEIALNKGGNYGVKGFGGFGLSKLLGFGQTFAATGGLTSMFSQPGMVGGIISRDNVDITVPTLSGGSTSSQQVSIPAFSAFLNLLQTYSDANIVSSPNLLTLDNEQAEINITSKIYANKVTTIATGVTTTEPTPLESGLILKLTPQISEGDSVRMKIEQELSNFTGPPNASGAAPSTKRKVSTSVVTNDGQTVVLGGLMQDNIVNQKEKIPIVGDIPLLGLLFKTTNNQVSKSNLLIFITPHVIRDPNDFSKVMQRKIEERNKFVDDNYGSKQRQLIRKTLAAHRADLLDIKPAAAAESATISLPDELPLSGGTPTSPTPTAPVTSSQPITKAPVITVPSVEVRSVPTPTPTPLPPTATPMATIKQPLPVPSAPAAETPKKLLPPPAPYEKKLPLASPPVDLDLAY